MCAAKVEVELTPLQPSRSRCRSKSLGLFPRYIQVSLENCVTLFRFPCPFIYYTSVPTGLTRKGHGNGVRDLYDIRTISQKVDLAPLQIVIPLVRADTPQWT